MSADPDWQDVEAEIAKIMLIIPILYVKYLASLSFQTQRAA
jgi:hypothetical protein